MSNSKVDIPYYQSKDLEAMDNTVIQERKEKLLVLKKQFKPDKNILQGNIILV